MGLLVTAVYRPKPDRASDLMDVLRDHLPILRAEGLVTDRPPLVMKASDGTMVEIFEWESEEAVGKAHENPAVQALWERFDSCSETDTLASLPGADRPFPAFEPIDL